MPKSRKEPKEAPPIDQSRVGVGQRLAAAREMKGLTQVDVATRYEVNKATVSAWETGRGDPGIYRLRELAKLYGVSADALLWANSLTNEAMQLASEYDGLTDQQKRTLRALWTAYISEATTDERLQELLPSLPTEKDKQLFASAKGSAQQPRKGTTSIKKRA